MLRTLLAALRAPAPEPLSEEDCRLALTALMVRVARADDDYTPEERDRIERIVAARYALAPAQADALRQEAELAESAAPDTVRFTRRLKEVVAIEDREALIAALWGVALVDGGRHADEDRVIRLVADLLGVPDTRSALIRQRVAREAGEGSSG